MTIRKFYTADEIRAELKIILLDTIDRLTFEHENEELGNAVVGAMSFFHAAEAAFLDEEELE